MMVVCQEALSVEALPQLAIARLLDLALTDPDRLASFCADPLAALLLADIRPTAADLKHLLGIAGASDRDLVELLRARVMLSEACCGCSGDD
jgi:hypothetical protein